MGFELTHVLSDERHYDAFVCAICQSLCGLDSLVTTGCSHVFCRQCLETWLSSASASFEVESMFAQTSQFGGTFNKTPKQRCPTCNRDLAFQAHKHEGANKTEFIMVAGQSIDARPLSEIQQLAHRVLRRVKVKCPLSDRHGCLWTGDYDDVQEHLVSATAHQEGADTGISAQVTTTDDDSKDATTLTKDGNFVNQKDFVNDADSTVHAAIDDDMCRNVDRMDTESYTTPDTSVHEVELMHPREDHTGRRRALAESFKEEANAKFSSGNYLEARDLYTKAMSVMVDAASSSNLITAEYDNEDDRATVATLYCNRAAAHFQLHKYESCVIDCKVAIDLNQGYVKAYIRLSKALLWIGKFEEAYIVVSKGNANEPTSSHLKQELKHIKTLQAAMLQGLESLKCGEFATAKATFNALLRKSNATRVLLGAARADLGLGLTDSSLRLSLQIIRLDKNCADAYALRGHCMMYMGNFDNGLSLLKEALRLSPDSSDARCILKQCRKISGYVKVARDASFRREFGTAVEFFSKTIDSCEPLPPKSPLYGILYSERAEAYLRQKNYNAALKDCALAIYALDDCVHAWLVKAKALHGIGRHEEARTDMEGLMEKWGANNDNIVKAYERADFEVRKQKRPDFYALFGIPKVASQMEIKKAYKARSKEMHPDRFCGNEYTEKHRKEGEENFKVLGAGLEILCDDFTRQLYDDGYDQEAIRDRGQAAQRAAHQRQRNYGRHGHGS